MQHMQGDNCNLYMYILNFGCLWVTFLGREREREKMDRWQSQSVEPFKVRDESHAYLLYLVVYKCLPKEESLVATSHELDNSLFFFSFCCSVAKNKILIKIKLTEHDNYLLCYFCRVFWIDDNYQSKNSGFSLWK